MVQVVNVNEGSTLNVREGPGTNYGSIGSAQPGERFVRAEVIDAEGRIAWSNPFPVWRA